MVSLGEGFGVRLRWVVVLWKMREKGVGAGKGTGKSMRGRLSN